MTILEHSFKNSRMLSCIAIGLVVVLHFVFFLFETVLWTTPKVRARFRQTEEQAQATKVLAGNQGVYNAALAASLAWAALSGDAGATSVLLGFVIVVGVYGAATAMRTILFIQAVPAAIALALHLLGL